MTLCSAPRIRPDAPFAPAPKGDTGLGTERSSKMRRILVPLDGTGAAEAAVKEIEAICEPGDEVVLISVSPPTEPGARGSRPGKVVSTGTIAPGIIGGAPGPDRPVAAETATQAAQRPAGEVEGQLEGRASPLART